ncbi:hypothetical protein ACQB6R_01950 [Propionibacteriaceae bacterium G1746]|uniref:hypothetical protein n=1 Tax=Aestuariimicrobium sp. G57 TaxID=3418485 RepID=UPI003C17BC80
MPTPITPVGDTTLHRYTVRPRHMPQWHDQFIQSVGLRASHGFTTHRVFVETDAEPKVSWLYSHPNADEAERELRADPRYQKIEDALAPHVFKNCNIRPVEVLAMTHAAPTELDGEDGRIAVMRRYSLVGDIDEFLQVWNAIVPVRHRHGFRCLFAVLDRPMQKFTWAIDFQGQWQEFTEGQRAYYRDPERVELRRVFDYMADYNLHPATMMI